MAVRVNRTNYYDAWSKRVVTKLKAGSDVIVVNLQQKSDLDMCSKLAGKFSARLTLSDDKTTCTFTVRTPHSGSLLKPRSFQPSSHLKTACIGMTAP